MAKYLLTILLLLPAYYTVVAQSLDTLAATAIKEIVVTGNNRTHNARLRPYTTSIILRPSIEHDNRHSLLPTLSEQVPGLFVTARSNMGYGVSGGAAGGISIRGIGSSPTTGVTILVDGEPQYMSLMGHPIADMALSTLAERVEVVRGPASAMYGSGAMGGVINIITRKEPQQGTATNLNLSYGSLNTLRSSIATMVHKSSVMAQISANYDRSDSHRANMGFEQYGGSAKLGVELGSSWDIEANVNLTHFNSSNPGPIDAPIIDNIAHITRLGSILSLRHDTEPLSGTINIIYNYGHHNIYDGHAAGEPAPDFRFISDDTALGISLVERLDIGSTQLLVGIDYRHYGGRASNRYIHEDKSALLADKHQNSIGSYININQRVGNRIELNAALRLDHNSSFRPEWIPQACITLHTGYGSQLKAIVSKGFRYPTIREMYMFPSQNPDLLSERLANYEIAFTHSLQKIRYAINIFYIDGDNMIQTTMVDGRPKNVNTGRVENFGFEAEISLSPTKEWQIGANYSYLNMKYRILSSPKHKLFINTSYTHHRWNIGTSLQYIAGLTTQIEPLLQQSYTLWNGYAEFRLSHHCTLFVRAENILGQRYEINAGFPMPRTTINTGIKLKL